MPKKLLSVIFGLLAIGMSSLGILIVKPVSASVSACTATISPTSVNSYSDTTFSISIQNTDNVAYSWIKVTTPTNKFFITSTGVSGSWNVTTGDNDITLTGSTLSVGGTQTLDLGVEARGADVGSASWSVQVSDDSGGASPYSCTGTLGIEISSGGTDAFPPVISNVVLSDISQTSVKVTWTTDENADSIVYYGTTSSYGSSKTDYTLTTSHTITIDNLTANTTYHFNVVSTDASGNAAEVGESTFVSSKASTTTTVTQTTTVTTTVEKIVEDKESPVITFITKFTEPFSAVPNISGKVTDNAGVAGIEYSIDGGENWLPVDETTGLSSKTVNFQFSIFNILDGNYKLKVRATDLTGNAQTTDEKILIFDRLPPAVGGVLYSLGSQILTPVNGILEVIAGVEFKVILSAVGGPTSVDLVSNKQLITNQEPLNFSLQKNSDTGLWSGPISFENPGVYTLTANSLDGAGNETTKEIGSVNVLAKGSVSTDYKQETSDYQISVFYYENTTREFVLWDGEAYGQINPIEVESNGDYSLILPSGKYYLQVTSLPAQAGNKLQVTSQIFELSKTTPINSSFNLSELKRFKLGPISFVLPGIFQPELKIVTNLQSGGPASNASRSDAGWGEFPSFELKDAVNLYDEFYFRGKPTVYTFLNTWSPQTSEQLSILEKLSDVGVSNVIVIPQESLSKVTIFKGIGQYKKLILADPDGVLFSSLNVNNLPTHFLTDRRGIIKEVVDGVLTEKQIAEILLVN